MITLASLFIFSENPTKLKEFYSSLFEKKPEWEENDYAGFQVGTTFLMIGKHSEVHGTNKNPERIQLNFEAEDVEKEFNRIKNLGATIIAEPYHPDEDEKATVATFADPDGNYFQLNSPWES